MYWEKRERARERERERKERGGDSTRQYLNKSYCASNCSQFSVFRSLEYIHFLDLLWTINCGASQRGKVLVTSWLLKTLPLCSQVTPLASYNMWWGRCSSPVFLFTQHSVVVGMIDLNFKEFSGKLRQVSRFVNVLLIPAVPYICQVWNGWNGNPLRAPGNSTGFCICGGNDAGIWWKFNK